jgi:dTDP-4-dehydrorhamnose reductase
MRVAVPGARGQLGGAVVQAFQARHEVVPLDLTDDAAVARVMERVRPDVIINCAAYNAVDAAEDHPWEALNVNAFAVRALARAATGLGAVLVHYSSDFVFDGTARVPYSEGDTPNPRSTYAASKLLGEWFAADAPRAYVLRVESLFGRATDGAPARGSVATIVGALMAGRPARVFEDRTVSPTSVVDGAWATRELIERGAEPGLYHCVNSGFCTWLELAREAARLLGVEPKLEVVRMQDLELKAERPAFCALSNERLARAGIAMPTWQDALARALRPLRDDAAHQPPHRQT